MAVTEKCKGTGLGALTLMNALDKSLVASRDVASWAVFVDGGLFEPLQLAPKFLLANAERDGDK
jgi:hypothetical protein